MEFWVSEWFSIEQPFTLILFVSFESFAGGAVPADLNKQNREGREELYKIESTDDRAVSAETQAAQRSFFEVMQKS